MSFQKQKQLWENHPYKSRFYEELKAKHYHAGDETIRCWGAGAGPLKGPIDEDGQQLCLSPANTWSTATPSGQKRGGNTKAYWPQSQSSNCGPRCPGEHMDIFMPDACYGQTLSTEQVWQDNIPQFKEKRHTTLFLNKLANELLQHKLTLNKFNRMCELTSYSTSLDKQTTYRRWLLRCDATGNNTLITCNFCLDRPCMQRKHKVDNMEQQASRSHLQNKRTESSSFLITTSQQNNTQVQIRRAVLSDCAPPVLTVADNVSTEVTQEDEGNSRTNALWYSF